LISHSTQQPSTFAQVGAVAALNGSQKGVAALQREYRARADSFYPRLAAIDGISCVKPAGSFYVFPNVKRLLTRSCPTTLELALRLLEEEHLAVVPGEGFAAPGYLRISFARSRSELRDGVRRLGRFLAALGKGRV
jgi:aspartate aminotransferase